MRTREKFVIPSRRRCLTFVFCFFSNGFPTFGDVYYVGKPIESAVCYFNNTNFNFPWIYRRDQRLFLTNQRARSILTILQNSMIIIFNFFTQIYIKRQRKRSTMENQYPSCAQGSEPNERFYFHASFIRCDRVNFRGE